MNTLLTEFSKMINKNYDEQYNYSKNMLMSNNDYNQYLGALIMISLFESQHPKTVKLFNIGCCIHNNIQSYSIYYIKDKLHTELLSS